MTDIDNGGPAFAASFTTDNVDFDNPGMSLRDYFAGQALAGLLVDADVRRNIKRSVLSAEQIPKGLGLASYQLADIMIKARGKS